MHESSSCYSPQRRRFFVANKLDVTKTLYGKLKENFENSDYYFKEIPNIIIGKIPKGPKESPTKKIIPYTVIGEDHFLTDISRYKNKRLTIKASHQDIGKLSIMPKKTVRSTDTTNISSFMANNQALINNSSVAKSMLNNQQIAQKSSYIEYVDEKRINSIFEKLRQNIKENRQKEIETENTLKTSTLSNNNIVETLQYHPSKTIDSNNNNMNNLNNNLLTSPSPQSNNNLQHLNTNTDISLNNNNNISTKFNNLITQNNIIDSRQGAMPKELKNKLEFQEKTLKLYNINENKKRRIEDYITKKINSERNKLLINSGETHLIKKEIINLVDSKIPIEEKNGIFNWIISLRRPNNFIGERIAYVNYGDKFSPVWKIHKDVAPQKVEKIINPNIEGKDYRSLIESLKPYDENNVIREIETLNKNMVKKSFF